MCVCLSRFQNLAVIKPLRSKKYSVDRLRYITQQVLHSKTQVIRTDQGGEFMGVNMGMLCKELGAHQETSCTGDSPQNGKAESAIGSVMGLTRAALAGALMSLGFWGYAFEYAGFTKNRMPCMH